MSVITVRDLRKSYKTVEALQGISFEVPRGSIYGFLGPNGAGKSTTISILLQFLHQDSGEVLLFGENVKQNINHLKRRIGFIPDADLPNLSGLRLLKHTGRYYGLSGQQLRRKIIQVVKDTDAKSFVGRSSRQLSKGQKTRIKVANALMTDPDLLIADEPTSGLDPIARRQFLELVSDLAHNQGKTVFLSSHVIGEVEKICDHLLILAKGQVVAQGNFTDILKLLPSSHRFVVMAEGVSKTYLESLPNVESVEELSNSRFALETNNGSHTPQFIKALVNNPDVVLHQYSRDNITLEDLFFQVIGHD